MKFNEDLLNPKIKELLIAKDALLLDALKQMDSIRRKLLIVSENQKYISLISIGDIQRAILANTNLASPISTILDANKLYATPKDNEEQIKDLMLRLRAECMPVIDSQGEIINVYFWEDLFAPTQKIDQRTLDLPVVIMAGGKGTRLLPLTHVIPKPLIPLGEKTILETIMDKFQLTGCSKFFVSLGYKADIVRYYLDNAKKKYNIEYIMEDSPRGTIGSVSMLKDKINKPFFVSNCDILIDQDFRDVYDYHVHNNNDITIIVAIKSYKIPYGVVQMSQNGIMTSLNEKPDMTYMINTGIYILNAELIELIPEGEFFHITHLIDKVRNNCGKVGCFPVSQGAWTDIGDWDEYLKCIQETKG